MAQEEGEPGWSDRKKLERRDRVFGMFASRIGVGLEVQRRQSSRMTPLTGEGRRGVARHTVTSPDGWSNAFPRLSRG